MIKFDPKFLNEKFGAEPIPVFHDFQESSRWKEGKLLHSVIDSIPAGKVKTKIAIQNLGEGFNHHPTTKEKALEVLSLNQGDVWLTLHEIEENPSFADLFSDMVEFLRSSLPPHYGNVKLCTGSLFISRGAATTPYHLDYGSNLLLQLRGSKQFLAFSPNDPALVSRETLSKFFSGNYNPASLSYDKSLDKKAINLNLEPGMGIYMPSTSPHCTQTLGSEISVTVSLSFVSPLADQLRRRSQFDKKFPRLNKLPDGLKCGIKSFYESLQELLGGSPPRHESFKPLKN